MTETTDTIDLTEINTRDARELAEAYDALSEADVDWSVRVESPDLDDDQRQAFENLISHTIGSYRGIVDHDQFISSGIYWTLVSEYAEEVIEALEADPDWADDDLTIFREIVMPTEMSRFYYADPVANFSTLYHSKHHATGWTEEYQERYLDMEGLVDKIEDDGWTGVLSEMAYVACVKDVAQKVRDEGYDLDLQHFEYER